MNKYFFLVKLLLTAAACFIVLDLKSQSNEGTLFHFAFMEHRDVNANTKVVMITSKYSTTGTVSAPGLGFRQNFTVAPNNVTIITLPQNTEVTGSENIEAKGLMLESDLPVSVYIHQYANVRSEASIVLPANVLGTEYYAMSYFGFVSGNVDYPSEMIIVATEDNTSITINPSFKTKGGKDANQPFTIQLEKNQVYQIQGLDASQDVTGSNITSDKPIAVFSGTKWGRVPLSCGTQDNLLEQMFPLNTWGRKYISIPTLNTNIDIFRVLASEDGTVVNTNGSNSVTYNLKKGEYVEFSSSEALNIESNYPIQVAQYLIGTLCNGISPLGDPSFMLLNSVEQTKDTVTLYNSSFQNITRNFINITFRTVDAPTVKFDGQLLNSLTTIKTVGVNNKYSYATLETKAGAHTITSAGCGVIANAYGYGDNESYAYSGGSSYRNINFNPLPLGSCVNTKNIFDSKLDSLRYKHTWSLGDGTTSNLNKFEKTYTNLDTYQLKLVVEDVCIGTIDTYNRDYIVSIRKAIRPNDTIAICQGLALSLSANDIDEAKYNWKGPNGYISEDQNPVIDNIQPNQSGVYTVVGSYFDCPTLPSTSKIDVLNQPKPNIGRDTFFCEVKTNLTLETTIPYTSYLWNTRENTRAIQLQKAGKYQVEVIDSNGCTNSIGINIDNYCPPEVIISNALAKNPSNSENAKLKIQPFNVDRLAFKLYDRWGNIIWQTNELNTSWDGSMRGKPIQSGVYPYSIVFEGKDSNGNTLSKSENGILHIFE